MFFFKLAFLIVLTDCCISSTVAQFEKYKKLSSDDLLAMCKKNNIEESEFVAAHTEVDRLFQENIKEISSSEALKTDLNCLGSTLHAELKSTMNIVKKCLEGQISLSDNDIEKLIKQSETKLCAANRLGSYEKTLSSCIDADIQLQCETKVLAPVDSMENPDHLANLGLTFSKQGLKTWNDMYDCTSIAMKNCDPEQQKTQNELTKRLKKSQEPRD